MDTQSATIIGICYALIELVKFMAKKALDKNPLVRLEQDERDILVQTNTYSKNAAQTTEANFRNLEKLVRSYDDMKAQMIQSRNESLEFSKILKESIEHNTQVIKDLTSYLKTKDQIEEEVEKRVARKLKEEMNED